jgi:hypothetical protein
MPSRRGGATAVSAAWPWALQSSVNAARQAAVMRETFANIANIASATAVPAAVESENLGKSG